MPEAQTDCCLYVGVPMSSVEKRTYRRGLLKGAAVLAPLAAITGTTALADGRAGSDETVPSAPAPDTPATPTYRPAFFTPDEWAFLIAACDRLIPADEHGPGAVDLGVPQYIDRQMGTPWAEGAIWYMQGPFHQAKPEFGYQSALTPKQQYRMGIKAIDAVCRQQFHRNFSDLPADTRDDVLRRIEKGELTSEDLPLHTFFIGFLLKNVMEGYFGDPMYGGNKDMAAWTMIAYPGVRADYLEWVGDAKPYPYGPVSLHGSRA
jgi:gluconate 2-dehydrogenase gamma chain